MAQEIEDSVDKTIWTRTGENVFGLGTPSIGSRLPFGVYRLRVSPWGESRFELIPRRDEELFRFDGDADEILSEIQTFWTKHPVYKACRIPYRRGILLYGLPGSGKSSLIRIALDDVVGRGGVGFLIDNIDVFSICYSDFRKMQPDTPIVAVIEDLECLCDTRQERQILDLLDGQSCGVDNTVFIATTNAIESLPDRIKNRPSRFDRRIEIGFPSADHRRFYFDSLFSSIPAGVDAHTDNLRDYNYIVDTAGMSLAHLKELFTAVVLLGSDYGETLSSLRQMKLEPDKATVDDDGYEGDAVSQGLKRVFGKSRSD